MRLPVGSDLDLDLVMYGNEVNIYFLDDVSSWHWSVSGEERGRTGRQEQGQK